MELKIQDLRVDIGKHEIVKGVTIDVSNGEFAVLLGPNGSGKSTLLKAVYRVLSPRSGSILLDRKDSSRLSNRSFAQRVAVLSQFSKIAFEFTVFEIVLMGRTPHLNMLESEHNEDRQIAEEALRKVGMLEFKDRRFSTLSGGEQQRVLLARCITQQPQLLILDEPTNHLDIRYQLQVLKTVRELGISCLCALHDLNLAAQFADSIYMMSNGRIIISGTPRDVLNPKTIKDVYGVNSEIIHTKPEGQFVINYMI